MLIVALLAVAAYVFLFRRDAASSALTPDSGDDPLLPHPDDTPASGSTVDGFIGGRAASITVEAIDTQGHVLRDDAAEAYVRMRDAAAAEGVELHVNSAWRSNVQQGALYRMFLAGTGNQAAPPGYSNHQSGVAVDIETAGGTNSASAWLEAHAAEFGFKRTVPGEPWHYEFSGTVE